MSTAGVSAIDRKLRKRKIAAPLPNKDQWDWLRNFIVRGLRRTSLGNFGHQDRRAIICSLNRLDAFLAGRFSNKYERALVLDAKLFASDFVSSTKGNIND